MLEIRYTSKIPFLLDGKTKEVMRQRYFYYVYKAEIKYEYNLAKNL